MARPRIITAKSDTFFSSLKELLNYRYLIRLFVKRDLTAMYKQTILGPFWFVLNPLLTSLVFTIIFGFLTPLPTEGIPFFMFYFSGLVCWSYFSATLDRTARTFVDNSGIFGKVYFPRLTIPISSVMSGAVSFVVQFLFLLLIIFLNMLLGVSVNLGFQILFAPLLMVQIALLGLGLGLVIASATTKYKDLIYLLAFFLQLWMYLTPIIYSFQSVSPILRKLFYLNPMTGVVLSFRCIIFRHQEINWPAQGISIAMTLVCLFVGLLLFQKAQRNSIDTI